MLIDKFWPCIESELDTANDGTTSTYAIGLPTFGNEHCKVKDPQNPAPVVFGLDGSDDDIVTNTHSETYTRTADTSWHVQTGGRAVFGKQNLWQFNGSAWDVLNKRATPPLPHDRVIDPTFIQIMGKNLNTNGVLYTILPDGQDLDATPTVAGKDFYTFNVSGQKYHSHFEAFVDQPWPNWPNDNFDPIYYPQPIGYPFFRIGVNGGHAWWKLTTDAPIDVVEKFIASTPFI